MRLVFEGFDNALDIVPGRVAVLALENQKLFSRVCESLLSGLGSEAVEPYGLWEGNEKLNQKQAFIPVLSPLELPWKHRVLGARLHKVIEQLLMEDDEARARLDTLALRLASSTTSLAFQLHGSYGFKVEWALADYLKAFGFGVEIEDGNSLFDKLIQFIDFAADMQLREVLLFINLETFLSKNEMEEFDKHVFFQELSVLLLEQRSYDQVCDNESKVHVDQHFLEYATAFQSDGTSSSQRGFCSNGFGAVTF